MGATPTMDVRQSLSNAVSQRLESISRTIEERYGVAEGSRDILLANYLYGLTTVIHADEAPAAHLAIIQSYLERVIPAERAAKALRTVPDQGDNWLASALERIEALGNRHSHAILARGADLSSDIPFVNRSASAAGSAEPVAVVGNAVEEALTR